LEEKDLVEYDVVGEARDGKEACQQVGALMPDLLITDLSMPGMSAIDVVASVKRRYPLIRHVVLSVRPRRMSVKRCAPEWMVMS
jgi:YesN/AraC family two-component response regulator